MRNEFLLAHRLDTKTGGLALHDAVELHRAGSSVAAVAGERGRRGRRGGGRQRPGSDGARAHHRLAAARVPCDGRCGAGRNAGLKAL